MERGNRTIQENIAAIKHDEGYAGKTSLSWMSWLPRIMYSMNTQIHSTTKEVPYKLVLGQMARCQVVSGAEQHIVVEEEIAEITDFSSPSKGSPSDSVPAIPVEDKPAVTSTSLEPEPHNWVIQKETVLNWTPSISPVTVSSASDSSGLPSLPSSPSSREIALSQPSKLIPSPGGSCSNTDLFHEDLSSDSKKRKEPDSPESRHESIKKKARDNTMMSATKMANYYNKTKAAKSKDFQVGDKFLYVFLRLTDVQQICKGFLVKL